MKHNNLSVQYKNNRSKDRNFSTGKKPLVSVIMPVFNAEKYLAEAIESVLNQTYENFEFLIIDDGSTDKSAQILKKYAQLDKRIKIFKNRTNTGMGPSLNKLLKKTTGTYIARMDADDICLAKRLEKQVELLENNTSIVACGGQEIIIDERGKQIAVKNFPIDPKQCYQMMMLVMAIQPPLLMARAHIFKKLKYDEHNLSKNDDAPIHFQLLQYGDFSNVDETLLMYRIHSQSVTYRNVKAMFRLVTQVRLNALIKYNYRPSLIQLGLFLIGVPILWFVPGVWIKSIFEKFRHSTPTRISLRKI